MPQKILIWYLHRWMATRLRSSPPLSFNYSLLGSPKINPEPSYIENPKFYPFIFLVHLGLWLYTFQVVNPLSLNKKTFSFLNLSEEP